MPLVSKPHPAQSKTLCTTIGMTWMSNEASFRRLHSRVERALRNRTGFSFSYDEIVLLLHSPVWAALITAEADEMRAAHPLGGAQIDD